MKVFLIGLLVIGGIIFGTVIDFIIKNGKDTPPKDAHMLSGVVTDISKDEASGLTKITVEDSQGKERHGYSSIDPESLKQLYMDKGWVQIPILKEEK